MFYIAQVAVAVSCIAVLCVLCCFEVAVMDDGRRSALINYTLTGQHVVVWTWAWQWRDEGWEWFNDDHDADVLLDEWFNEVREWYWDWRSWNYDVWPVVVARVPLGR